MWVQVSGMIGANSKSQTLTDNEDPFTDSCSLPTFRQTALLQGK